ncbi:alpha/beta fold hydrolase [Ponticaulis profundi]|uniref:Alpha/beta fold hydrolase n=1 Tax=Ponticaulis profundi TaxID=2665222 RepID=A0ABW1SAS6_9PROT
MAHVSANGIGLEYEEFGSRIGTPLLLISGFSQQSTSWPESFVDGLVDAGFWVITFDNRDIGLSHQFDDKGIPDLSRIVAGLKDGTAPDLAPYLLDDMADDAAALLTELEATPAIVMGVSMGGMITQLLALRHPDKVKAIIPTMTTSGDLSLPPATPEAQQALLARPDPPSRRNVIDVAIKSRRVIGSVDGLRNTDDEIAMDAGRAFDRAFRPAGTARQYAAIVAQPRWHERLSTLNVPTMVLHGAVDPLIRPASGKDVADRIPGASFVEVEGWGHDMPVRAVPTLLEHVTGFANQFKN